MDYIHYEANHNHSIDAKNALLAVERITGIRGSATDDLYEKQEQAQTNKEEINSMLNTVTCRIM